MTKIFPLCDILQSSSGIRNFEKHLTVTMKQNVIHGKIVSGLIKPP